MMTVSSSAFGLSIDTQESTSEEINSLIERLENANGHIPDDFTQDEMNLFLTGADPEIVSDILNNIYENALPVPLPSVMLSNETDHNQSEIYFEYDPVTGEETVHSFSEISINDNLSEGIVTDPAQPFTHTDE
jgi:hypothetical protein